MRRLLRSYRTQWLMTSLTIVSISACNAVQVAPATPIEVTRVVPVTQIIVPTIVEVTRIVQAPPIEVTRLIEAPPIEVTRVVPVTRIVQVEPIVEVTRLVIVQCPSIAAGPATAPIPTVAPAPTAVPPPIAATPAMAVPRPTPVTPIADNALPVWYDFEGDFLTSGIIADRSGNGHVAQVVGTVAVTEGLSGGQALFLSGNGYIQAQSNPVAGRSIVSFSLWFKTDHPEANYKLASAAWWSGGPGSGWILATHIPEFWSDDTQSLYLPGISNNDNHFAAGEWMHEVVTYDGHRIREYTNGQLVNDWPTTGAAIGQGLPMAVGAWPSFQGYNFQGSIDEFRVFDRALTLEQVRALYNQR